MYHRIRSAECPLPRGSAEEARYAVTFDEFCWQMDHLQSVGMIGVALGQWIDGTENGPERDEVVLTFDDGNLSDAVHALPVLKERGFAATFFVGGHRIGVDGGLDETMIRELADSGMEIASHGVSHGFMTDIGEGDVRRELGESKERLTGITGKETRFFAPPGGRYDRVTIAVAKELGYRAVCTSEFGYNRAGADVFALRRIPITQTTSRATFEAIVAKSFGRLWPTYLRWHSIGIARKVLGDRSYRRLRGLVIKD